MAQGDSISGVQGVIYAGAPSSPLTESYEVRPPVGEVWLITFITLSGYSARVYLVDTITGFSVSIISVARSSIEVERKFFLDNNFYLSISLTKYQNESSLFTWYGVQFK